MKTIVLFISILFSSQSFGGEVSWLADIYVDTLNKVNIKGGIILKEAYDFSEKKPHYYGSFKYMDLEVGQEGNKITIGAGQYVGHGLDRIGLSYASLKNQDLAGIEAIISQMGINLKMGYYFGLNDTTNKWLLGIGYGF